MDTHAENQESKLPLTFSVFHLSSENRNPFEALQQFAPFCIGLYDKVFILTGTQNEAKVKEGFEKDSTGIFSQDLYWDPNKKISCTVISEGKFQELLGLFSGAEFPRYLNEEFKNCLILFDEASFSSGLIDSLTPFLHQVIIFSEKNTVDFVESYQLIKSLLVLNKNLRADFFLIENEDSADPSILHDFEAIANKNLKFNGTCQFFFEKFFNVSEKDPSEKRNGPSFKFSFKQDAKKDSFREYFLHKMLKLSPEPSEEKVEWPQ